MQGKIAEHAAGNRFAVGSVDRPGQGRSLGIQYSDTAADDEEMSDVEWISEARALVNRALVVWLTVLGILTIGGFLK